jgi:hypothetical protein
MRLERGMSIQVLEAPPRAVRRGLGRMVRSTPALLFGLFCAVYALTAAGRLDSADGGVIALTARTLLQQHTIALPANAPDVVAGVGGHGYSRYGLALSVVEIPFAVVGLILRHFTHQEHMVEWAISYTNVVLTALGATVFYLLLRRLGASERRSVALTLVYGFATLAWPYAKSDFYEPLQSLSLLAAAYATLRADAGGRLRWLAAAGAALGVCVLTKPAMGVVVPAFACYAASGGALERDWRWLTGSLRKPRWWRDALRGQLALLGPVAGAVVIALWLNVVRFGGPLDFGYDVGSSFTTPLYVGVFGLLFSVNTGLVFYATPVLLGVAGLPRFARVRPRETLLIGLLAAAMLLLYGGFRYWAGLAAFGPRFLVPLVPFLLLPAVEAFPGVGARPGEHPWAVALIAAVVAAGVAEQLLGVLVSFGAYSALTCLQSPCPASLDASQSELLYDLWLLRASLAYNLLGTPPHVVLHSYPFGAPPPGRPDWYTGLLDRMRYFWWAFLPRPRLWLALGVAGLGGAGAALLAVLAARVGLAGTRGLR